MLVVANQSIQNAEGHQKIKRITTLKIVKTLKENVG